MLIAPNVLLLPKAVTAPVQTIAHHRLPSPKQMLQSNAVKAIAELQQIERFSGGPSLPIGALYCLEPSRQAAEAAYNQSSAADGVLENPLCPLFTRKLKLKDA